MLFVDKQLENRLGWIFAVVKRVEACDTCPLVRDTVGVRVTAINTTCAVPESHQNVAVCSRKQCTMPDASACGLF